MQFMADAYAPCTSCGGRRYNRETLEILFHGKSIAVGMTQVGLGYAMLAGAIYVAHAFCWQLGLIYRTYHDRFPWILQRHIPVRMAERTRSIPGRSHPGHLPPLKAE